MVVSVVYVIGNTWLIDWHLMSTLKVFQQYQCGDYKGNCRF
jgi:hypothetical protein